MQASGSNGNSKNDVSKDDFLIVGIGASAGGVQALKEFFENVGQDTGIAYVVILHLSPDHDSKLAEVLQAVSKIPVKQVKEKVKIIPDHVYVVPPNKHLTMEDNYIVVSPNLEVEDRHAPVDIFFRSLAEEHKQRAVCVVLSGTGANGSMGLKRLKELGGATYVQNPREAEFNEMPRNSIATGMVDEVLPVAEIPNKIISYSKSIGLVHIPIDAEQGPPDQQHPLREVFAQLHLRTGHDFTNYKRPTLFQAEELKAANEELQAMNEETRSAAEELETSKEEVQSINEELRTVNQELKIKVEETTIASNNLKNLINSAGLATILLDRSFRVTLFSPAARDIFNLIPADNGRLLSNITGNLEYKDLLADAQAVLNKLQPIEREVSSLNGHVYLMRVLPYRTEDDRINGVVITFFDITNRKHIEKELRASEERLRLLIESAKDYAIFTQDTERKVNTWNTGAELMFGYSEKEIMGYSADIFFTPEDRKKNVPQHEIQKAADHGSAVNERWHMRKDGSRFYGSGMVRPLFDHANKLVGFVKIMRDLTEHKRSEDAQRESEERLRITMNSATDYAVITLNTNGNIVGWSKGAEMMLGHTENEVEGKRFDFIFTAEDQASGIPQKEMRKAAHEGKANDERWHVRKDGARFFMSGVMTPIVNDGRLVGFVKVARDLTDRKLLEQQKDEFIGIASHELKTPVTSIKAYSELLLEMFSDTDDTKSAQLVRKLDGQVNRLIDLIHTLLDTTKISAGKFPLHLEDFDLNILIEEQIEDMQRVSKNHQIILQAGNINTIKADRERIGQVITNLVSNAIKYSPAGGQVIIKTIHQKEAVEVIVSDSGIGIPMDVAEKVFERFYRVAHPEIQSYPGMGLGLYISAGIIQRHGGRISVQSTKGKGSSFHFILPYNGNEQNG